MNNIGTRMRTIWAGTHCKGLLDLIELLPSNLKMIEIGCYAGESTKMFLDSGKVSKLYAVDPFIGGYDPQDVYVDEYPFEDVFNYFKDNILNKYFDDVVELYKMLSIEAADKLLKFAPFDFVYIDGDHTYEGIKQDIRSYLPLIKDGGIIAGHDYNTCFEGVKIAVDGFFGSPDKTFEDNSWIKFL